MKVSCPCHGTEAIVYITYLFMVSPVILRNSTFVILSFGELDGSHFGCSFPSWLPYLSALYSFGHTILIIRKLFKFFWYPDNCKCMHYYFWLISSLCKYRDIQASSVLLDDKFEVRLGSLGEICTQQSAGSQSFFSRILKSSRWDF